MSNQDPRTLGDVIRDARVAKGLGLRELARTLEIAPSYLSDIENDRRVPSEDLLRTMSSFLDVPFDRLMALAGRVGEQTEQFVRREPAAGALFRKISQSGLRGEALQKLAEEVDRLKGEGEG